MIEIRTLRCITVVMGLSIVIYVGALARLRPIVFFAAAGVAVSSSFTHQGTSSIWYLRLLAPTLSVNSRCAWPSLKICKGLGLSWRTRKLTFSTFVVVWTVLLPFGNLYVLFYNLMPHWLVLQVWHDAESIKSDLSAVGDQGSKRVGPKLLYIWSNTKSSSGFHDAYWLIEGIVHQTPWRLEPLCYDNQLIQCEEAHWQPLNLFISNLSNFCPYVCYSVSIQWRYIYIIESCNL